MSVTIASLSCRINIKCRKKYLKLVGSHKRSNKLISSYKPKKVKFKFKNSSQKCQLDKRTMIINQFNTQSRWAKSLVSSRSYTLMYHFRNKPRRLRFKLINSHLLGNSQLLTRELKFQFQLKMIEILTHEFQKIMIFVRTHTKATKPCKIIYKVTNLSNR